MMSCSECSDLMQSDVRWTLNVCYETISDNEECQRAAASITSGMCCFGDAIFLFLASGRP